MVSEIKKLSEEMIGIASKHVEDILSLAIQYSVNQKAVVVMDTECQLALALTDAYRRCLPEAQFINFYEMPAEEIMAIFDVLKPSDLVVLIQSTSFRLDAFRLRVELFKKSLKVIEHPHLARMVDRESVYYIESLAYDPVYYHGVGHKLKKLIDNARGGVVDSGGESLVFESAFEPAKLNIGDYSNMTNVGGQFPIGEVFTEAKLLEAVNGRVNIFAFADLSFSVAIVETPITLIVNQGRVIEAMNSVPSFDQVLENIRADEGEVWLRELGFGMNPAFTKERVVCDIGTYERMCGIHFSLGSKHGVYKKANFRRADTWHHVDVFAVTEGVYLDGRNVFKQGKWVVC